MATKVKTKVSIDSTRIKSLDFHPTKPWVLTSTFTGLIIIYDYITGRKIKEIKASQEPVRCARFVRGFPWIVCGADDRMLRCYDYNTQARIASFKAHEEYIRHIIVHPTRPWIFTCSDDTHVRVWDFADGWKCLRVYVGHTQIVLQMDLDPERERLVTASYDKTIKMWDVSVHADPVSKQDKRFSGEHAPLHGIFRPMCSLVGHEKSVNCVKFIPHTDTLLSGSDDMSIQVWDLMTRTSIRTIKPHVDNVSDISLHPFLPIAASASEDGTVSIFDTTTFTSLETILPQRDRVWCAGFTSQIASKTSGRVRLALGCDTGLNISTFGLGRSPAAMDKSGRIAMAVTQTADGGYVPGGSSVVSGKIQSAERTQLGTGVLLSLRTRSALDGAQPVSKLSFSTCSKMLGVVTAKEYVILSTLSWKTVSFGSALDIAWGPSMKKPELAILRDSTTGTDGPQVLLLPHATASVENGIEVPLPDGGRKLISGPYLTVIGEKSVTLISWTDGKEIKCFDLRAKTAAWSSDNTRLAIATTTGVKVFKNDREIIETASTAQQAKSLLWVGPALVMASPDGALRYGITSASTGKDKKHTITIESLAVSAGNIQILGSTEEGKEERIIGYDAAGRILEFTFNLAVVQFQIEAISGEVRLKDAVERAKTDEELDTLGRDMCSRFLERIGKPREAALLCEDPMRGFALATDARDVQLAIGFAEKAPAALGQSMADFALEMGNIDVATRFYRECGDMSRLFLVQALRGDNEQLRSLSATALEEGQNNIGLFASFAGGDSQGVLQALGDRFAHLAPLWNDQ